MVGWGGWGNLCSQVGAPGFVKAFNGKPVLFAGSGRKGQRPGDAVVVQVRAETMYPKSSFGMVPHKKQIITGNGAQLRTRP